MLRPQQGSPGILGLVSLAGRQNLTRSFFFPSLNFSASCFQLGWKYHKNRCYNAAHFVFQTLEEIRHEK